MASPTVHFIDNPVQVTELLRDITGLPTSPPSLYLDVEGINLGRTGTISILQIHVSTKNTTYLIDVYSLGASAFTTATESGQTLKFILESPNIPKVFFDVRNDSDAMFSLFGISLAGVHDVQLMELATRHYSKKFLSGLTKCVEEHANLSPSEKAAWQQSKDHGKAMFAPERGGAYEVFNQRPLPEALKKYCAEDVQFLPRLWSVYMGRMNPAWQVKVQWGAAERVRESQTPEYDPNGPERSRSPKMWSSMW
ncbi:hypothetical protein EJ06DRAFT_534842 [Trichodelitschia bisporula]|uniref:3'-5' exonuclease domain-containing protein n=1 Tax=Trichodelitschia bisporula TaxID=703511 RepID=A0A6G1HI37_9PEZI|nr:hypothetical protein EJ06DRAFT_534842 [Trichodelitschia bisporula]